MSNKLKVKKKIDIRKILSKTKDITVKVGFPKLSEETLSTDSEGATALEKAVINNFGLGVPKRPFMSISFAKNKKAYRSLVLKNFSNIKNADKVTFYNKLGLKGQGDVQNAIVGLKSPANNPSTIKQKGSSNPLMDSGHMRQSATFQVKKT